ncbi:hypothetical protein GCM10011289_29310 [Paludibacterium paludis]|uniref:Uncharacterized protein n=2 Tax=Paludibacterium paludis TaxID=1225769 RepID=A0A918P628_9NEIS|nr:hypothetical protein GCM10011289_29310 [Paludibacterium paludis]
MKIIEDKTLLRFRRLDPSVDQIPEPVIRIAWRHLAAEAYSRPCLTGTEDPLNITVPRPAPIRALCCAALPGPGINTDPVTEFRPFLLDDRRRNTRTFGASTVP